MTEDKFEQAVEQIFDWSWSTELIVSGIFTLLFIVIGEAAFKKQKENCWLDMLRMWVPCAYYGYI